MDNPFHLSEEHKAIVSSFVSETRQLGRQFLAWKYANWALPTIWVVATVMLAINRYTVIYALTGISAFYSSVLWWNSKVTRRKRDRNKRQSEEVVRRPLQIIGLILILLAHGYTTKEIREHQISKELERLKGRLYPASDATPYNPCPAAPENTLTLVLGSGVAVQMDKFPYHAVKIDGRPTLSIGKNDDGSIYPILDVMSDGKIVARLNGDGFEVNPNHSFGMKRLDMSTLVLDDDSGNEVLNLRYLNRTTLRLSARLEYPGLPMIRIPAPDWPRSLCFAIGPGYFDPPINLKTH